MDSYDKKKIGKLIAWGSDHFVYLYGENQVIKFSLIDFFLGTNEKTIRDYTLCKKFFEGYLLNTQLLVSPNHKRLGVVQPFIQGHSLLKKDLEDTYIKQQFNEIMNIYHTMVRQGYAPIDLIGQAGIFHQCMSNIFVMPDKKLTIMDATLIDIEVTGKSFNFMRWYLLLIRPIVLWRQCKVINYFKS